MRRYLIGAHVILGLLMSASFIMSFRETLTHYVIKNFWDFVSKDPYTVGLLFITALIVVIIIELVCESRWVILPAILDIFLGGVIILAYFFSAMMLLEGMDRLVTVIVLVGLIFIGHEVGVIVLAVKYFGQR